VAALYHLPRSGYSANSVIAWFEHGHTNSVMDSDAFCAVPRTALPRISAYSDGGLYASRTLYASAEPPFAARVTRHFVQYAPSSSDILSAHPVCLAIRLCMAIMSGCFTFHYYYTGYTLNIWFPAGIIGLLHGTAHAARQPHAHHSQARHPATAPFPCHHLPQQLPFYALLVRFRPACAHLAGSPSPPNHSLPFLPCRAPAPLP